MAGSVLERGFAILAAFSVETPTRTLSELSRATGLPLTTVHRQVAALVRWGALERGADGRYGVGLRLWEVGSLAARGGDLREAALPYLEDLYEVTHENVQLAVLDGRDVLYVERISGHRAVHVVTRPGSRLPAHATAVGLVLLAYATDDQVAAVLSAPLQRFTARTITSPARLRRVLSEVRRDGYAISDRQIEDVSVSVAAPVYARDHAVAAALSIVVSSSRGRARHFVPAVLAAARGVSRRLGAIR